MKKLNISSQFFLVFFSILLITSTAFSLLTMNRIRKTAEREVYSRLSTYIYLLDLDENKTGIDFPDMPIEYFQFSKGEFIKSPTIDNFLTTDEMKKVYDIPANKQDALIQYLRDYITYWHTLD